MVEILNENDNRPSFLEHSIQPFYISELTAVNTVVFTVQASDADEDIIMYIIDKSSPDASYFRIDLPNSGKVVLAKPLDYETKALLEFVIYAVEMNTEERYNTTATITVHVLDGDDQYPQFQPCNPLSQDHANPVCTNPIYMANITEKERDTILQFSPGPIHAEDGDRGLRTPLLYTILSGGDNGRFLIDNETGEVLLTRPVENRLRTPIHRLRIMASQRDDPKKYTVATALVRVLAQNRYPPQFNRTTYRGFITENSGPAALVNTYGDAVLVIQASDPDFRDGYNPKIQYSLRPKSNNTRLYHITQEGLLIARTDQLQASEKHFLEVLATDGETGEVVKASVDIEVLPKGQAAPRAPFGPEWLQDRMDVGMAGGVAVVVFLFLVVLVFLFVHLAKRRRRQQDLAERASVAQGKHPNVVDHGRPMPLIEEVSYLNKAFTDNETTGSFRRGIYTKKSEAPTVRSISWDNHDITVFTIPAPAPIGELQSAVANGRLPNRAVCKTVSFQDEVELRERGAPAEDPPLSWGEEVQLEAEQVLLQVHSETPCLQVPYTGDPGETGQRDTEDSSDGSKQRGADTPPKSSKEQEHRNSSGEEDDDDDGYDEDEDAEQNPYKYMHSVICLSDDDEQADDEEEDHANSPSHERYEQEGERGGAGRATEDTSFPSKQAPSKINEIHPSTNDSHPQRTASRWSFSSSQTGQ
ncbi:cadherin-10-like [Megalops cyprinoides]|uniref:cadherin-10-like n=1 Tax=Megalops cyprinoides TaxID=118141 RepID=UPI0018641DF2|nr:cadherin-10-like [Megalops cyprinoides]